MQVVNKSQFSEKEQNCVKLANPPSQTSNKKKNKNKKSKNAVSLILRSGANSMEIATSNDVTDVDSFSELLQLPVDEEMVPTQLSSSLVKPKRRATPIQVAHNELESGQ